MIDFANQTVTRTVIGTFGTALCASLCLLAATTPAQAGEVPQTRIVSTADLDLSNSHGRATLANRINQAARAVCNTGSGDLHARIDEARCTRAAKASAQPRAVATADSGSRS